MSHGFTGQLPDRILRMLDPADRKALGKAGMTAEEALAKAEAKSERDLQNMIENLLRLKGIVAIRSRMDKKTTNNKGTPDFVFCVCANGYPLWPVAWEVKLPGGKLSDDQKKMAAQMTSRPNAWQWTIITSVDEAILELQRYGIK